MVLQVDVAGRDAPVDARELGREALPISLDDQADTLRRLGDALT